MSWIVNVFLASGRNLSVGPLEFVSISSFQGNEQLKTDKLSEFHLQPNQSLSFVGSDQMVSLSSNEIEYVEFLKLDE